jgi:TP901 family phage tail tape measure protein
MGNIADSALTGISTKALVAGAGVGAIALGAVAAGRALYDLGAQWDDISDSMTIATGKTGDELQRMTDIVGDVGKTTAAPLGVIGGITQQLTRSLPDLQQNDAVMRQMVSNLSYLNANGVAVDVRELGMAFRAFGVDANHAVPALDSLNRASQNSDIPLNELISSVRAGAPQFRQFGLSIGQSTSLLTSFAQAGVSPEVAVTGLRTALKNAGGEGKEAASGLAAAVTQIKALHDAQQEGSAQQLAGDIFGTRNAPAFLQAIESGTLNVEALNKAMEDAGLTLRDQQGLTDDWAQSFEKIKTPYRLA